MSVGVDGNLAVRQNRLMSYPADTLLGRRVVLVRIVDVDQLIPVGPVLDVIGDDNVTVRSVAKLDQRVVVVGECRVDVADD